MDKSYYVVLITNGETGEARSQLQKRLEKTLKLPEVAAIKVASRPYTILKRNITFDKANKLKQLLESIGCDAQIQEDGLSFIPPVTPKENPFRLSPTEDQATNSSPVQAEAETSEQVKEETAFCRNCGRTLSARAVKCEFCNAAQLLGVEKSKVTAGLLAIFIGGFGVHRFYLGQWWGLLYILFWGTGIPSILSIFEGVVILFTSKKRWDHRYGKVQSSPTWVFVVVGLVCMIAVVGILAAIALPAYQTYITRSKVAEGLELVSVTRDALTRSIETNGHLPDASKIQSVLSIVDNEIIASVEPGDAGKLTVTFHETITVDPDQTIILQAQLSQGAVSWDCTGGTLINQYRPLECRNKNVDGDSTSTAAQRNKTVFSDDRMLRIDVPRRWSSVLDLSDIASIQTGHLRDEQYFMAIKEAMSDMPTSIEVHDIAELMAEDLSESLDNGIVVQGATPFNINGHQALLYEVHGSANGYPLVYRAAYLATEMHYYQLMAWTLKANYDDAKPIFDKVMQSFQELSIDQ